MDTFLDDEGRDPGHMTWPGTWITVSLHPLWLIVDIVLRTMTILTALKYYFEFSNFIFQKSAEGICESTCVSAVWKR